MPKAIPAKRADFLMKRLQEAAKEMPEIMDLRSLLLNIGGTEMVAPPQISPMIGLIIECGELVADKPVQMVPMSDSECHRNVSLLWRKKGHSTLALDGVGTGFALSKDGLWREHSWAFTADSIIETTESRVNYFGLTFQGEAADIYARVHTR